MTEQLKPCPFCGKGNATTMQKIGRDTWSVIACEECGTRGPECLSDDDAVDAWNHRTQTTPDALFDPEAEGWERSETPTGNEVWRSPGGRWRYCIGTHSRWLLWEHGGATEAGLKNHPTTALVHEIIRLNGGDNE